MKQYLPYNVLLVLALVATGIILVYNTVIREGYATTLRYTYPAASQQTEPPTQPTQQEAPSVAATEATTAAEPEPETEPPTEPEAVPAPTEATALTSVQFPLDINTATAEEIMFIPGVGNAMAQRIIQYRDYIGGAYGDLEQLKNISGVGDATYAKLWAYFIIEGDDIFGSSEPTEEYESEDKYYDDEDEE